MRDPERIYKFKDMFYKCWLPDVTFFAFTKKAFNTYGGDTFYVEDNDMLDMFAKTYTNSTEDICHTPIQDTIISLLMSLWEKCPDWRFGQLMYNIFGMSIMSLEETNCTDENFEKILRGILK